MMIIASSEGQVFLLWLLSWTGRLLGLSSWLFSSSLMDSTVCSSLSPFIDPIFSPSYHPFSDISSFISSVTKPLSLVSSWLSMVFDFVYNIRMGHRSYLSSMLISYSDGCSVGPSLSCEKSKALMPVVELYKWLGYSIRKTRVNPIISKNILVYHY